MLTATLPFDCPWCGEPNYVEQEPGDVEQWIIQDCAVCCRPIELRLPADGESLQVRAEGGE